MKAQNQSSEKIYPPVTRFEKETGYCPEYVADGVILELQKALQITLPTTVEENWINQLAERAQRCYAKNEGYRKRVRSRQGLEYIQMFFCHWLCTLAAKQSLALYQQIQPYYRQRLFR